MKTITCKCDSCMKRPSKERTELKLIKEGDKIELVLCNRGVFGNIIFVKKSDLIKALKEIKQ